MALTDLPDWLDEQGRAPTVWFVKRLQANDTLATKSHQAGPYLPKELLFAIYPALADPTEKNPRVEFDIYVDSQGAHRRVKAIWYNNELHGGTRNETRITGFGGGLSDLLDPESTGAVAILAFDLADQPTPACHAWVCRDDTEGDLVEQTIGRVDPASPIVWIADGTPNPERYALRSRRRPRTGVDARKESDDVPVGMPTIETLVRRAAHLQSLASQSVDLRLLRRYETLIELFDAAEQDAYAARAGEGFSDLRSLLEIADRIRRGRQAKSDDALALQLADMLEEEGFQRDTAFSFRPEADGVRGPDFVFPAVSPLKPVTSWRHALFVEPTVRDRWRSATSMTVTGSTKILTVQRGVSDAQFDEMSAAGVILVVPGRLHDTYPATMRSQLLSVESFLADVRHVAA